MNEEVLFVVDWKNDKQCISDLIINYCKQNGIEYKRNHFFKIEILVNGEWILTDYVYDKDDIFKIIRKETIY